MIKDTILNGQFKLIEQLGHGGFSEVWKAYDLHKNNFVAIKMLHKQNEEGIELCKQEFKKTYNLRHSNIVPPVYFDVWEKQPYLIIPYIDGGSCANKIGLMTDQELETFINQITQAIQYIHSLNVPLIHGDIKPDNILIDTQGNYYLTDFGISNHFYHKNTATLRNEEFESKDGITPVAYRSPETFKYKEWKSTEPSIKSDIWSFGVTIYYLYKGFLPFNGEGGWGQLILHYSGQTDLKEMLEISGNNYVEKILLSTLCLQPKERSLFLATNVIPFIPTSIPGTKISDVKESDLQDVNKSSWWQNRILLSIVTLVFLSIVSILLYTHRQTKYDKHLSNLQSTNSIIGYNTIIVKPNIIIPLVLSKNKYDTNSLSKGMILEFIAIDNVTSDKSIFIKRGSIIRASVIQLDNGIAKIKFGDIITIGGTRLEKLILSDFDINFNEPQNGNIYIPRTSRYQKVLVKK